MKNKSILLLKAIKAAGLLFVLVLNFSSCLLQSEENYFKKVDPTPDPRYQNSISYSYSDYGSFYPLKDTVWLSNKVRFQWGDASKVYKTTLLINDQPPSAAGANAAVYGTTSQITKGTMTNGTYILKIKQQVATGTGSLADKSNNEFTEYTTTCVLVVESANAYVPKITSLVLKDGSLRLSWNQYNRDDFQNYKIVKSDMLSTSSRAFVVKNQLQTTFADTTYVGGPVKYQLVVNNGDDMTSTSYPFNYTYKPVATLTKISDNHFRLSWSQPATYNSTKMNHIYFGDDYNTLVDLQADPLVSSVEIANPIGFGFTTYYIRVDLNAKVDKYISGLGEQSTYNISSVYLGQRIPSYTHLLHDTQKSSYYLLSTLSYTQNTLYQLDDKTFSVIDSAVSTVPGGNYNGRLLASANGQYHYIMNGSNLRRFDPNNLSITETTSYSTLDPAITKPVLSPTNSSPDITAVTDNNYVLFQNAANAYSYVADMNAKAIVFKFSGTGHLSSDGMYLVNGSNLYTFSSGTYTKVLTLPYSSITYEQFLNGTSRVVLQTATSVILYDCTSQTEVASYSISCNGSYSHLDQSSQKLFLAPSYYPNKILDLNSGTVRDVLAAVNSLLEGDALFNSPYVLKNY